MGITVVNKSGNISHKKTPSKLALVLAGGAISGGAYKVGGLKALNDYLVNKKMNDFDIYVGLSAGAVLAAPLAGGIPPEEMLLSLDGKSDHFSQLSPIQLYRPNVKEFVSRPAKYLYGYLTFVPGIVYDLLSSAPNLKKDFWKNIKNLIKHPSYSNYEQLMTPLLRVMYSTRSMPYLGEVLPSGFFDSRPLEEFMKRNMKTNRMTNNFKVLKKMSNRELYISAMNLDTSERVVFGHDEKNDVTISEAVQASSSVPGFYKPARIKGVDYIDGGVRRTANIDIAFDKGADLVICYNPFRPYNNEIIIEYLREEKKFVTKSKRIADWGMGMIINQVFRTLFHSRLMTAIQYYKQSSNFKKDLILIEPKDNEGDFFELNPLFFWNRAKAASQGFESVSKSIDESFDIISPILKQHGLEMTKEVVKLDQQAIRQSRFDPQVIMDVLEDDHKKETHLRVVQGGR